MPEVWGKEEVAAHMRAVHEYFQLDPNKTITGQELLAYLEAYDKVHPITQEQANTVTRYLITYMEGLQGRNPN